MAALPKLQTLSLSFTGVTDEGAGAVAEWRTLCVLSLAKTAITDAALPHLARLPLRVLHLHNTAVTDAGVECLRGLHSLQTLSLYGTRLTDVGLGRLAGREQLRELNVEGTAVTAAGVRALRDGGVTVYGP